MAGDWLKITHDLPEKPEFIGIMQRTGLTEADVFFTLFKIWSWFDRQTTDGKAPPYVTQAQFDASISGRPGFADAMTAEGWLSSRNGRLALPNFDRHCSKSAKQRALGADRARRFRNARRVTNNALEERRGEERRKGSLPYPSLPSLIKGGMQGGIRARPPTVPPEDYPAIRADCRKVADAVYPHRTGPLEGRNRDQIVKLVLLARFSFNLDWLWTCVDSTASKPRNHPGKYLHAALRREAERFGVAHSDFNALVSSIAIPADLYPPRPHELAQEQQ